MKNPKPRTNLYNLEPGTQGVLLRRGMQMIKEITSHNANTHGGCLSPPIKSIRKSSLPPGSYGPRLPISDAGGPSSSPGTRVPVHLTMRVVRRCYLMGGTALIESRALSISMLIEKFDLDLTLICDRFISEGCRSSVTTIIAAIELCLTCPGARLLLFFFFASSR